MAAKPISPPPAYFLSLSLENVRSFGAKQTISFATKEGKPAQWTIILGDNGVGKTTVLKSLASITPFDANDEKGLGIMYARRWRFMWSMLRHKGQLPAEVSSKPYWKLKLTESIKYDVSSGLPELHLVVPARKTPQDIDAVGWRPINQVLKTLVTYGYGASRSTGESTIGEVQKIEDNCLGLFNDKANLLNAEEWFLQADYYIKSSSDELTKQNFSLLRQALITTLDEVDDLRVSPVSSRGNPEQGLELRTPYGWVRLRDMSLGYQTLVVWLTDFASKLFIRYPDSPNPLEEPAIVLIDEIDLHLHPSWQRKLIGFLSDIFKNTQFIATAHSPLVVQAAGDESANVVVLKRKGDETIVYQGHDLPDVRAWRVEQIMNSELFDTPPLSPQTEADLTRRNELLLKKRLTKAEKAELAELETAVADQPAGTTRAEQRADSLLARLSRNLNLDDL